MVDRYNIKSKLYVKLVNFFEGPIVIKKKNIYTSKRRIIKETKFFEDQDKKRANWASREKKNKIDRPYKLCKMKSMLMKFGSDPEDKFIRNFCFSDVC